MGNEPVHSAADFGLAAGTTAPPHLVVPPQEHDEKPGIVIHGTRPQRARHAIFISAGDRQTFATYALDRLADDFDILIFFYGSSKALQARFLKEGVLFAAGAGTKFTALKEIFLRRPEAFLRYETIWVCDDDIQTEHGDVRLLPALCTALNVPVLSPAHSRRGKMSHPITLPRLGRHVLRYTTFVEMTCPLFATPALVKFLEHFHASPGGYADDWWFLNILEADRRPIAAIVDAVTIVNPHDAHKPGGFSEIEQVAKIGTLRAIWHQAMRQHGLREWPQRNLFYLRSSAPGLDAVGANGSLFRRSLRAQLRMVFTELNYRMRFYGARKWLAKRL